MHKKFSVILFLFFITIPLLYGQRSIQSFDNNWTINLTVNYHSLLFVQDTFFICRTNKPLDLGFGVKYKKFALGFSIELPYTSEYFRPQSESFEFNLDYVAQKFIVNAYLSRYHSFFTDNLMDGNKAIDLDIMSAGSSFRWILNYERHSLQGIYKLDRKLTSSSGSPLVGFGAYYNTLYSDDKKLPGYETRQHYIYASPLVGYSYILVLPGQIFIQSDLVVGINNGLNVNEQKFAFMPIISPHATIGQHLGSWTFSFSFDATYFVNFQSFQDGLEWHQLVKMKIAMLRIMKRF